MMLRQHLLLKRPTILSSSSAAIPIPTLKPHRRPPPPPPLNHSTPQTSLKFYQSTVSTDSGLKFREKIYYLQSLGVNPKKALQKNPNLRTAFLSSLHSVENCLSSIGIDRSALGRILDMHPQLLTADPYADIYPIFDFLLNEVGIPYPDVEKSIVRCPRLLVCSVENQLKPALQFLKNLGFVGPNKITCQNTVLLVSNVDYTLAPKIDYLVGLGFQYDDVAKMVLRSPGLLTFSIENNYKPKTKYFLEQMSGKLEDLRKFPQYFCFSLEGKIKPRHQSLVKHGFSMRLSEMLKISDGEFNARLVEMQLQLVEKISQAWQKKRLWGKVLIFWLEDAYFACFSRLISVKNLEL